jgi:hypothetical protein
MAWAAGDRAGLLERWAVDRGKAWASLRRSTTRRDGDDDENCALYRALNLIHEGEIARGLRMLHSNGVSSVTPAVIEQLKAKHPP